MTTNKLIRAQVILRGSSSLEFRTLGSVWLETVEVRRALLVGLCYDGELQLKGSWNDVLDMRTW